MTVTRGGVSASAGVLWAAAWAAWLATGTASTVPPWRAEAALARDEQQAHAEAQRDDRREAWSIEVGGARQGHALGDGWGLPERRPGNDGARAVRAIEDGEAHLSFESPAWPAAHAAVRTVSEGPATLELHIDGRVRAQWALAGGEATSTADVGPLARGRHDVSLHTSAPGVAVSELQVSPDPRDNPSGDGGFVGFVREGLHERPAFVRAGAAAHRRGLWPIGVDALHGWVTAGLVTLVTGLAWAGLLGQQGLARLSAALGFSTVGVVLVFLAVRVTGLAPQPLAVAAALGALGGLPLLRRSLAQARVAVSWRALAPAAAALVALTAFATHVVPPLDDQDLEVQATAHAMAHRLEPSTVTDRGTTWFFAHPPLLHTWVAASFALSGRLDRVAYADEAAADARARQPFDEALADRYPPAHYGAWKRVLARFFAEPLLWPTRQVNVVLAAAAVGIMSALAGRIAGSTRIGVLAAAVLATFPEFLIRGAYGGYFAPTLLLTLLLLASLEERWPPPATMPAAALAFLSDQKGLLVPVAWAFAAPFSARWRRVIPLAGALVGIGAFTAWGLGVDAPTFIYDFAKQHVARRLAGSDIRLGHDAARWYPSIPELWTEFARHYGLVFTLSAAAASVWSLRSDRAAVRAAGAAVLLGAVVFTLTDWRQTKHLSLLAAPALVAIVGAVPSSPRGHRAAFLILATAVAANVWTAAPLLRDFDALKPSTIW